MEIPGTTGNKIRIRVWTPKEKKGATSEEKYPVAIWIHGGGFVLGHGMDSMSDKYCKKIVERGGFIVASIDYRLAPEHPFPAAVEDVYIATHFVLTGGLGDKADLSHEEILQQLHQ